MKKLLIGLLALGSLSSFSYDGGLLARNCFKAQINKDQLFTVVKELNKINVKYSLEVNPTGYTDYLVTTMARNSMLKVDLNRGVDVYFKMNKKLRKVNSSEKFLKEGIDFRLTSVGACKEFKKD